MINSSKYDKIRVMNEEKINKSQGITDDIEALLGVLPFDVANAVRKENDFANLLEIILDLGRYPSARFVSGEIRLLDRFVNHDDLDYVTSRVSEFDADNRAGMERTLHRISAMRNRRGRVVGLTCRVGRAVYGTIDIIEDLVNSGESILILGKPGVGKTTILREAARTLADKKRVIIVDTSNEIGGDGDVPHPAVGSARRMQVPKPSLQHEVMIEAVENHNPEVIVIDEIGRELEALAARTIAERGVQLIGTAHGNALENLLLNPTLSDLVGGIESVTLSDDEARRRGTQKTVLERRSPPTFNILVEIQERNRLNVHRDIASAVDAILRGYPLAPEERYRDEQGKIRMLRGSQTKAPTASQSLRAGKNMENSPFQRSSAAVDTQPRQKNRKERYEDFVDPEYPILNLEGSREKRMFVFGVARNRLLQAIKSMNAPVIVVREMKDAEIFLTQRRYYRDRLQPIVDAEAKGLPIFVIRSNSMAQIEQFLADTFGLTTPQEKREKDDEALAQVDIAVDLLQAGEPYVDLQPTVAHIRKRQHELAREYGLVSQSFGKDPNRYVRIYRD